MISGDKVAHGDQFQSKALYVPYHDLIVSRSQTLYLKKQRGKVLVKLP